MYLVFVYIYFPRNSDYICFNLQAHILLWSACSIIRPLCLTPCPTTFFRPLISAIKAFLECVLCVEGGGGGVEMLLMIFDSHFETKYACEMQTWWGGGGGGIGLARRLCSLCYCGQN